MSRFAYLTKSTVNWRSAIQLLASLLVIVLFLKSAPEAGTRAPQRNGPQTLEAGLAADDADAATAVQDAWQRAQASGAYHFTADILQTTTPLATALNAGRPEQYHSFYLEGETNLPEQQLTMSLWTQAGSVSDPSTAVQVRVDGDKSFTRQGDQPWEPSSDFTGLFAPNSDFMNYLVAAKNIRDLGSDRRAGIEFTRYAFEIDGPGYAAYMRDQMEAQMRASGALPYGMSLGLPQQYVNMIGNGEIWITGDGWPLRQIINLQMPAQNESQVSADITVNFSDFDKTAVASLPTSTAARLTRQLTQLQNIDPIKPLVSLSGMAFLAAFLWLILTALYSRKFYIILNLSLIVAMLGGPLIRSADARQFTEQQTNRAQEQDAGDHKSDMAQALADASDEATTTAQERFAALKSDNGADTDSDGYTDVEESLMGTNPLSSPLSIESNQVLAQIPPDNSDDSDEDGLTDYEEFLVNTFPDQKDTDGDGIQDYDEVTGFLLGNQQWYTNPHLVDSNGDGLSDTVEWGDLASSTRPDSDGDGFPDLFDPDNDGDGVPDRVDISPYVYEANPKVYSEEAPLSLVIDNLKPNELTYVELQLRPTNPDHLWYAFNVLDWPSGDKQASMQDEDGLTFADIDSTLTPIPHENGDIKLIPVLEVTLPQENNNLPDDATLGDYNIEVSDLLDSTDGKLAYVPIHIVTDADSGEQVAFYAKIPYLPGEEWGTAHQIRLVWVVQALVDVCDEYLPTGECSTYSLHNEVSIIQSYPDDWSLTGVTIRENIESKTATIYEDPAVDPDLNNDDESWQLMLSLDEFFLGAYTVTDTLGIEARDVTVDSIYERFDHTTTTSTAEERWDLDNVYTVVKDTYEHVDKALFTQASETNRQILSTAFANHTTANPTLIFAREDIYRSLNLDEMQRGSPELFAQEGNKLTINMEPNKVALNVMATLKWSPYVYSNGSWNEMGMEPYWELLEQRHQTEFIQDVGTEDAAGGIFALQLLYMSYFSGLVSVVELNDAILSKNFFGSDTPVGASIAKLGRTAAVVAAEKVVNVLSSGSYRYFIELRDGAVGFTAIKSFVTSSQMNLAIVASIAAVTLTLIALRALFPDELGVRIALAVVVVILGTLLLVVKPAITVVVMAQNFMRAYQLKDFSRGLSAVLNGVDDINKGTQTAAIVGLVVSVGIALGIFIWAVSEGNISAGTPVYNQLVGQLAASIVVAVIIFVFSLSLVGLIVLGIVTVIDLFLLALGSDFSITGALTNALAEAFFSFQLMVENPQVDTSTLQLDFIGDGADKGLIEGNPIQLSLVVSTTITHTVDNDELVFPSHFTKRNLKSTTVAHELSPIPVELSVDRDQMRDDWVHVELLTGSQYDRERGTQFSNVFFGGFNTQTPSIGMTPTAGVNTSTPIYLNSGFAFPGVSCVYAFFKVSPNCDSHTLRGSNSSDIGSGLVLDVLPATLDEFYALDWGGNRPFPQQRDHDGDGLIANIFGGSDPNDSLTDCNGGVCWDFDGDGYGDKREVALQVDGDRNSPFTADADNDGICDPEELRLGTDPQNRDTDGDGLWDGDETWHYSCTNDDWRGGWAFQLGSHSIQMVSDPLTVDADGDGLSDNSERDLYTSTVVDINGVPYHPNIANDNPLGLTIDFSHDVVGPDQPFVVTTTVKNNSPAWAYGTVTTTVPALANGEAAVAVAETIPNLNSGQFFQQVVPLTVPTNANSGPAIFAANAGAGANSGSIEPTWSWLNTNPPASTTTTAYRVAIADMPAAIANQQNGATLSAATLEGPGTTTLNVSPLLPANGFNRQIVGNSGYGNRSEINPRSVSEYNSDLVANTNPDVACNDAGECLTVSSSAYWFNCKTASFVSIYAINQTDQSGGSEFYIHKNGRDWNADFNEANGLPIWENIPTMDDGDKETAPSTLAPFQWCEGDTIDLWEGDGDAYKADDYSCSFRYTNLNSPGLQLTSSGDLLWTCNPNDNVHVEITVRFEAPPAILSPQWQGDSFLFHNCTTIDINELLVRQTDDGGTIGGESEYYIQLNGTNRGSSGSDSAEGTLIWDNPNGVSNKIGEGAFEKTVTVGTSVWACRGDTIDIWEDDGSKNDDFICSIYALGHGGTNPTSDPTKSTQTHTYQRLPNLNWVADGGICRTPDNKTQLDLTLRARPNPIYRMTAGLYQANGAPRANGILLRSQLINFVNGINVSYKQFSNPAVASDGSSFLTYWTVGNDQLWYQKVSANGTLPRGAAGAIYSGLGTLSDVDVVWVGNGKYLVAIQTVSGNIYVFYTNTSGDQITTPQIVVSGNNIQRQPDLAVNPATGEALLVYQERVPPSINKTIYARLISNNGSTPNVGAPIMIENTTGAALAEVAYSAEHNIWIVSVDKNGVTSRALKSNGIPFDTTVLPPNVTVGIDTPFSLACDQKSTNASCTLASVSTNNDLFLHNFQVIKTPLNLNDFTPTTSRTLIIDTTAPTTTLSLPDSGILPMTGSSIVLSGQARDVESGVARIEIRFGSDPFVDVTDGPDETTQKEAWGHMWTPANGDGPYTIEVRLTDRAGNVGTNTFSVTVDNTTPTISSDSTDNALLPVTEGSSGTWFVTLSGTVNDGSGIMAVVATTQQGDKEASLNCSSNTSCTWSVDYPLPTFDSSGLSGPSGTYTAQLQAIDDTGKTTDLSILFRVDGTAPIAQLLAPDPLTSTPIISGTALTVSGVITDPGDVATGVDSLQIALVETGTSTLPDWQTAVNVTLDTPGAVSSAWNYRLPTDIEGNYEIHLRGTDVNQNTNDLQSSWFSGWQGIIDTKPPEAAVTITPVGRGNSLKYNVSATVTDTYLSEDGWSFVCDSSDGTRTTVTEIQSDGDTFIERLIGLDVSCEINGKNFSGPVVLQVFDSFGNQTTVTTPLPQDNNTDQSSLTQPKLASATQTSEAQPSATTASVVASTVLTPTNNSVLTSYDPVAITGGAYADDNLDTLTLSVNGTTVYTESWATVTVTDTLWTTTWTPSADGVYEFVSEATDQNGATQTVLQPVTVIVDTQAPSVTLDTVVISETQKLADELVALTGTLTENLTLESVRISIDGARSERAVFDATTWRYAWPVDVSDDGKTYSVAISASDGGNVTTLAETVTVDILPPIAITPTLSVTDGSTPVTILPGGTVRDPQATTLRLNWTPSSDGSGIAHYEAQWNQVVSPTIGSMTTVLPSDPLSHQATGTEATAWFAHLRTVDGVGNSTLQTEGPIYLDAPTTPDYINPADGLTTNIYRGWMDSGCSQIGSNYEIFRNALDGTSLTAVQEMYLTWDAANLRIAWAGANWDVDGDLFIYFDTASGGATTAYDPYGSPLTIGLPAQDGNQLAANYLLYIEDGATAELLAWNGSSWTTAQTLSAPNYFYNESITDLYLPLSWLGDPTAMKLVALASEEDTLHLWATMPGKNPLNSDLVASYAALPFLDTSFSLQQQYEWTTIGADGICPSAGQFENSDLVTTISSTPTGAQVGYLAYDLPGLLQSNGVPKVQLDNDNNGIADLNEDGNEATYLPLDTDPSLIGPGGSATYTIRITNDGSTDATGVQIDLAAYGAMSLSSGTTNPAILGDIPAGSFVEHTFTVDVDQSTTIDGGEVTAVVSDAIHGPFDWLWVLYDIDHEGPTNVTINGPLYINPDLNRVFGVVSDASDVPTIILEQVGGGSSTTCTDPSPADGAWVCVWDAAGFNGATLDLHARGIDEWGNAGAFGPTFTFILDDVPPTISLDATSVTSLNDGLLLDGELLIQGVVSDDNAPAFAELCAQEASETEQTCTIVEVSSSTGRWVGTVPVVLSADGESYTLTFTGIDVAGNRSTTPLTYSNVVVDTTGPDIDVTTFVINPTQFANITVLAGTVADGSGVASMSMWISKLDGTESLFLDNIRNGVDWSYSRAFSEQGPYSISLEAADSHGNIAAVGPLVLTVLESTANLPPTVSLGAGFAVNEGSTIELNANASDPNGDTLTIDWDLDNNGTFETSGASATFDATAIDAPATPQEFPVSVRVSDGVNNPVEASTVVSVVNASPVLNNLSVTAITENDSTTLTGTISDPATADSFTLEVNWGDGTAVESVSYAAGTTTFSLTHQYLDDNPANTPVDNMSITLTISDDDGGTSQSITTVQVSNSNPTLTNVTATAINENGTTTVTGTITDAGTLDSFTLEVDWGDGTAVEVFDFDMGATSFNETHQYLDDNPTGTAVDEYTISLTLQDDDLGSSESSTAVTVSNVAPVLAIDVLTQTVQYSDGITDITISGTDVADDPLQASTSWNLDGGAFVAGLPDGMSLSTNTCFFSGNGRTCSWTISGIADVIAGSYVLRITVEDDDLGQTTIDHIVEVVAEDTSLSFDGDNPVAVRVDAPGSDASEPFSLVVTVEELEPDLAAYLPAPGNINLAQVSIILEPVGPGSPVTGICTPDPVNPVTGYDDVLTVTCNFDGVPVNTYSVSLIVDGGYYTGYSEDAVVIYDPSLGFTTGGGWFYWPGSEDPDSGYPGDKTNFGYTMKYNKPLTNIQGNLLLIRHLPDGTIYRLKSNALEGLALGDTGNFGWASFAGKGTYLEPGWPEPIGNHKFLFYVEDHNEPGNGIDKVWVEVRDKDEIVIPTMSMTRPGSANAVEINGGNIVVPHSGGTGN